MQKLARQAGLPASWQRYQRRAPAGDGGSSPVLETGIEPRCVCSSPSVMWEGEYFCIGTGDVSDKCCGAMASRTQATNGEFADTFAPHRRQHTKPQVGIGKGRIWQ